MDFLLQTPHPKPVGPTLPLRIQRIKESLLESGAGHNPFKYRNIDSPGRFVAEM
jgi:hypothetical protein